MRKLVLKMSISADGFVGGPNGEIDWTFRTRSSAGAAWVLETLKGAGVHIMGSRTFQGMAGYWPTSSDPLAAPMNEIPKVVFSRTGRVSTVAGAADSWTEARVAGGDIAEEIAALKRQEGKFILAHGGPRFAQSLAAGGFIDEYRLVVHPVVIGRGLPLFGSIAAPVDLKLESSEILPNGVIANIYTPLTH